MITNLVRDQQRLFWVLHLGGWYAYGLIGKYASTRALTEETVPGYFLYVMVITTIAMLLSLGLRYFVALRYGNGAQGGTYFPDYNSWNDPN